MVYKAEDSKFKLRAALKPLSLKLGREGVFTPKNSEHSEEPLRMGCQDVIDKIESGYEEGLTWEPDIFIRV